MTIWSIPYVCTLVRETPYLSSKEHLPLMWIPALKLQITFPNACFFKLCSSILGFFPVAVDCCGPFTTSKMPVKKRLTFL